MRVRAIAHPTSATLRPNSFPIGRMTNVKRKKSKASSAQPRKQAIKVARCVRSSPRKSCHACIASSKTTPARFGSVDSLMYSSTRSFRAQSRILSLFLFSKNSMRSLALTRDDDGLPRRAQHCSCLALLAGPELYAKDGRGASGSDGHGDWAPWLQRPIPPLAATAFSCRDQRIDIS